MAKKQPHFETETQEAEWWVQNQDLILKGFQQAKASGKLGKGTVGRVASARAKRAGHRHPDRVTFFAAGCPISEWSRVRTVAPRCLAR